MAANEQACLDGSVEDIVQRNQIQRILSLMSTLARLVQGLTELESTVEKDIRFLGVPGGSQGEEL